MKFKFGNIPLRVQGKDSLLEDCLVPLGKTDDQTQDYSPFKEFTQLTSLGVLVHLAIF